MANKIETKMQNSRFLTVLFTITFAAAYIVTEPTLSSTYFLYCTYRMQTLVIYANYFLLGLVYLLTVLQIISMYRAKLRPDFGVLRFIANDEKRAAEVLRASDHVLTITPVLAVALKDEPGSFARVMGVLADAGIDVEYVYTFLTPRPDSACMVFRVADNDLAEKVLSAAGIRLASKEEFD